MQNYRTSLAFEVLFLSLSQDAKLPKIWLGINRKKKQNKHNLSMLSFFKKPFNLTKDTRALKSN